MRQFRSFVAVFALTTLSALLVRLVFFENFRVDSRSMEPTLMRGDFTLVLKSAYNLRLPFSTYEILKIRRPDVSEIVAFTLPDRGLETFIKRVVAIEGDKVLFQKGRLIVNGVAAEYLASSSGNDYVFEKNRNHTYLVEKDDSQPDYGPVDIPPGHFFVLGDNRRESADSRTWGPVPYSCLKGRVRLVWLSLSPEGAIAFDRMGLWIR